MFSKGTVCVSEQQQLEERFLFFPEETKVENHTAKYWIHS